MANKVRGGSPGPAPKACSFHEGRKFHLQRPTSLSLRLQGELSSWTDGALESRPPGLACLLAGPRTRQVPRRNWFLLAFLSPLKSYVNPSSTETTAASQETVPREAPVSAESGAATSEFLLKGF